MNQGFSILGIAGSLRRQSYNRAALEAAKQLSRDGVTLSTFDISGIPSFNQDDELTPPAAVVDLKRRIRAANALLFVTPEYNYSIPGVLKNAIDWVSRPHHDNAWSGKPAAIMGASVGTLGTARAQYHLRQIFVNINVFAINQPEVMIANAPERFDPEGRLIDEVSKKLIRQLLLNLEDWANRVNLNNQSNAEGHTELVLTSKGTGKNAQT